MQFQASFDLTEPARIHYRGVVRTPRWSAIGFLVLFSVLFGWRVLTIGFDLIVLPVVVGIPILVWIVFFYAVPGPIRLNDLGTSVEFTYPRGSVRRVTFGGRRLRLRLLERAPLRPQARASWTLKDADHVAIVGSERIALTPEAFQFLDAKAISAGYQPISSVVEGPGASSWRMRAYSRLTPR